MSGNSIAISRELVSAGVEEKTASAVAEAIVTHASSSEAGIENRLHNLENRVQNLEVQFVEHRAEMKARFHILSALVVATFVGVYAPMLQNLFGG